ncbi:hypothetical protein KJ786_02085 [Patescibacteria group bacterium]|nr:hypothetical protein [Patescibacteria group bacterium]
MAKEVIKKDGTKEPFDAGKIRNAIVATVASVALSEERKNEVVEQVVSKVTQTIVEGKDEIPTSEIKENILSELDSIEPSVSAAWRKYEQEKQAP